MSVRGAGGGVWGRLAALEHEIRILRLRVTSEAGGGVPAAPHATEHYDGGDDEVDVTQLGGFPGGSPLQYLDSHGNFTTPDGSGIVFPGGSPVTYLDSDGNFTTPDGGGGGGEPFIQLSPLSNEPPTSAMATPDLRNAHPVLDFDGATDEEAVFRGVLPNGYGGGGLTVDTFWAFTSATSGSLRVQAAIERINVSSLDIDADSFASFNSAGGSAPGTSGQVIKVTVTFASGAEMDSLAAGEMFRLKIRRDADGTSGTDDITTDAELVFVTVRET
jgi:hypothetical protein